MEQEEHDRKYEANLHATKRRANEAQGHTVKRGMQLDIVY